MDLGDIIPQFYELDVYMSAPLDLRMERVKQRLKETLDNVDTLYFDDRDYDIDSSLLIFANGWMTEPMLINLI